MRAVIRTKLELGETSDQIITYFVARYGESVLVEPPRHGVGLLVWLGPVAGVILGMGLLLIWWNQGKTRTLERREAVAVPPADDWQIEAAERELRELGGERP
jgi:cytochrome c-type biogenesis protein CcmH